MTAARDPGAATGEGASALARRFRGAGLSPSTWSNEPGYKYAWHAHGYHKILFCARGSITFHLRDGDVRLEAGDRLDVGPGTEHAATVHADGVTCVEAAAEDREALA